MVKSTTFFIVEIKSREIIKPSSPTPPALRNLQLSLLDQLSANIYTPLILFYTPNGNSPIDPHQRSDILRSSFSQALTHFYPLAGRIKDYESIECNDNGADSVEAHVNCSLAFLLQKPDVELLRKLLPIDTRLPAGAGGCLLSVQANFFECGGLAIGACFSHRIADAFTFISFMKSWADTNAGKPCSLVSPQFSVASSIFSPVEHLAELITPRVWSSDVAVRRIVFRGTKIAELKGKAAGESVSEPTRVEAVTALVLKCAMAASRSNHGLSRPSTLSHVVNLRKRIALPSPPESSMGNIYSLFFAETDNSEKELPVLVSLLRRNLENLCEELAELEGEDASSWVVEIKRKMKGLRGNKDLDLYIFSSWCKFPMYEADFGWGKPTWVTNTPPLIKNCIFLMDTRDGDGIEAWVPLSKPDMAFFERDENLLAFASLDPIAL